MTPDQISAALRPIVQPGGEEILEAARTLMARLGTPGASELVDQGRAFARTFTSPLLQEQARQVTARFAGVSG